MEWQQREGINHRLIDICKIVVLTPSNLLPSSLVKSHLPKIFPELQTWQVLNSLTTSFLAYPIWRQVRTSKCFLFPGGGKVDLSNSLTCRPIRSDPVERFIRFSQILA